MTIRPSAKKYLDENLLPKFTAITSKDTDSDIFKAMGLGYVPSSQSFLIQCGYAYEDFWNYVISDCPGVTNLLLNGNKINLPGAVTGKRKSQATQQIDHSFRIGDIVYYRESKCNLNFDSEKSPTSVKKIITVAKLIAARENVPEDKVSYGYFVPVLRYVSAKTKNKATMIATQDGVADLVEILGQSNLKFTVDEYFYYHQTTLGAASKQILKIK